MKGYCFSVLNCCVLLSLIFEHDIMLSEAWYITEDVYGIFLYARKLCQKIDT